MTINSKLYVLVVNSNNTESNIYKEKRVLAWLFEIYRTGSHIPVGQYATKDGNPLIHDLLAMYYQENLHNRSIEFELSESDMYIWNRRANLKGMTFRTGLVDNRPFIMRSIDNSSKVVGVSIALINFNNLVINGKLSPWV